MLCMYMLPACCFRQSTYVLYLETRVSSSLIEYPIDKALCHICSLICSHIWMHINICINKDCIDKVFIQWSHRQETDSHLVPLILCQHYPNLDISYLSLILSSFYKYSKHIYNSVGYHYFTSWVCSRLVKEKKKLWIPNLKMAAKENLRHIFYYQLIRKV